MTGIQCQIYIFPGVRYLVAYKKKKKKMRMFTTIRDESDRLLKSATVLLISFDSVPLLSFLLHSTCAGVACYIGIRVSQISSILETNRTVDGTRVNVTREIHRNYIGIRVLIRVSRVNDVHEDFHSRRIKLNINFKGERKKKKKKLQPSFTTCSTRNFIAYIII